MALSPRSRRLFYTFTAQRAVITCEISEVHFLIQCFAGGVHLLSLAVYAYWAMTLPMARRSHRYAFGSFRPRHIDAVVMILLLANPVQGLDNAVRRQAKYSSTDGIGAAGPSYPLHQEPTDGDTSAKVAAESMMRGFRAFERFTWLGARHRRECFKVFVRHQMDECYT